jgi:hypothetical protein
MKLFLKFLAGLISFRPKTKRDEYSCTLAFQKTKVLLVEDGQVNVTVSAGLYYNSLRRDSETITKEFLEELQQALSHFSVREMVSMSDRMKEVLERFKTSISDAKLFDLKISRVTLLKHEASTEDKIKAIKIAPLQIPASA